MTVPVCSRPQGPPLPITFCPDTVHIPSRAGAAAPLGGHSLGVEVGGGEVLGGGLLPCFSDPWVRNGDFQTLSKHLNP